MQSQKLDTQLNLALETSPEERMKSLDLAVGYNNILREWELIIRYLGDISFLEDLYDAKVARLIGGYAVVTIGEQYIDRLVEHEEIIYVEKPNNLFLNDVNANRTSCITRLTLPDYNLTGKGILVAVIDSGIDYAHPDFRNADGSTRILAMWDQSAIPTEENGPPQGYYQGVEYSAEQINAALSATSMAERMRIVPETDLSGHGTFVAGVAAGNGRASNGVNKGVAVEASLLIVKLGNPRENSFPRTTELMLALDYVLKKAIAVQMPLAINLSFGNNYGSHDGTELLETFIDVVTNAWQTVVGIGSGNEGNTGRHASVQLQLLAGEQIPFSVASSELALTLQLWKNYADDFQIAIIAPDESRIVALTPTLGASRYQLMDTQLDIYYGMPKPYQQAQEIYIDMVPKNTFINEGEWRIELTPVRIVDGRVDMWLPVSGATSAQTRFLLSSLGTSLTIPGTANRAITVGAYDSRTDAIASFSGRGYTRVSDIKPDLVAPGVEILSCAPGGGYTIKSGTSMATPFVTGSAALLMQWGILEGNDPYLYGDKVKAYLIRGARQLPGFEKHPNPQSGWGALCLADSLP